MVLSDDLARFIEEQGRYVALLTELKSEKAAIDEALKAVLLQGIATASGTGDASKQKQVSKAAYR